ncbi:carbamoyltransferase N-terminal domain-containing protein [Glycomyces paridis]|uniref:Nodulation protein U n=1 Tax=Glycomyces paridis TaxID=2126555 RepID=A0A4V6T686_9ACTN|nr:carbamoyltransferase N-terminal domain-containing protein [Glycomyces paridis]THV24506.1 nodulation protein U [Glycomyces paridis]
MIVCGLKLTHDGAVALIDGDRLVFSVEMEKLGNAARHSQVADLAVVTELLAEFGYSPDQVDRWVVDGWDGAKYGQASLEADGEPLLLQLAPYRETEAVPNLFEPGHDGTLPIAGRPRPYTSHVHVAGHVASAYGLSPFGQIGEPALVLVWDGGSFPRLYHVDPDGTVENGGALFPLTGHAYAAAAHHFGPFQWDEKPESVNEDLSVAGKLMAYIALGTPNEDVITVLRAKFEELFTGDGPVAVGYRNAVGGFGSTSEPVLDHLHRYFGEVQRLVQGGEATDADVLASVHVLLERLLTEHLRSKVIDWKGEGPWKLCFVGGCALNIKWNSRLREVELFDEVWVPPFPNDSGSAIGAAALGRDNPAAPVAWDVRLGPDLKPTPRVPAGWSTTALDAGELGRLLHRTGQACVVLDGRAELGPRALGGRSIIAPAVSPSMKDLLNEVKDREPYRPVAPICLEEHAPAVFSPGTPDPYMLFDHEVRPEWLDRVPAIVHLDGTARLQTVGPGDGAVRRILEAYHAASGIPVLCNTSANLKGSGFFPDVASAVAWGQVDLVWSDGLLYRRDS